MWHRMVEQNIPAALILEDDFDFQANFKARLGEYLSEAQGLDWNLMPFASVCCHMFSHANFSLGPERAT